MRVKESLRAKAPWIQVIVTCWLLLYYSPSAFLCKHRRLLS